MQRSLAVTSIVRASLHRQFTIRAAAIGYRNVQRQQAGWLSTLTRRGAPNAARIVQSCCASFHSQRTCFKEQEKEEQALAEAVDPKHQLLIGFTCEVCKERSHHVMSKLAYTKGVVLIECPGCKNRHLIADNLGWFRDTSTTVEDLVKEKGEAIRKVIVDDRGQQHQPEHIMEWLPEISEEERAKKENARQEAEKLRKQQEQQTEKQDPMTPQ